MVEFLIADAGDQVLAMLRGKIQFLQDTCFVFSGSVRSDKVDIFTNPKSPFFKSAMTISVANIAAGEGAFHEGRERFAADVRHVRFPHKSVLM